MLVLAGQGLWVKHRMEVLAPAAGPTTGSVGDVELGEPVRVAVIGESTAAGCGVTSHDDGFPGALCREVLTRTGRAATWEVVGQHGATSKRVRYRLLPELTGEYTVSVVLAGANDVLSRRTPAEWADDLGAIVDSLVERSEQVLVVGIPPFKTFPSIPGALRRYLAEQASAFDEAARQVCAGRAKVGWVNSTDVVPIGADFFASDRFHPSAHGYRIWAETVADHIKV